MVNVLLMVLGYLCCISSAYILIRYIFYTITEIDLREWWGTVAIITGIVGCATTLFSICVQVPYLVSIITFLSAIFCAFGLFVTGSVWWSVHQVGHISKATCTGVLAALAITTVAAIVSSFMSNDTLLQLHLNPKLRTVFGCALPILTLSTIFSVVQLDTPSRCYVDER